MAIRTMKNTPLFFFLHRTGIAINSNQAVEIRREKNPEKRDSGNYRRYHSLPTFVTGNCLAARQRMSSREVQGEAGEVQTRYSVCVANAARAASADSDVFTPQ